MHLLTLIAHFAVFAQASKLEKRDFAIITTSESQKVSDCVYSLLHERALGAQHLKQYMPHDEIPICYSNRAEKCELTKYKWFIYCVQRFDAYYTPGNAPNYTMEFTNANGKCLYRPFSNDVGGQVNDNTRCLCSKALQHTISCV